MSEPIGDLIHQVLASRPDFVLLPSHMVDAYKREIVPDTLPDEVLGCIINVRVHRAGHTAIVASEVHTEAGVIVFNGYGLAGIVSTPSNPVTGYNL